MIARARGRRRALATLVASAVVLAACSDDGAGDDDDLPGPDAALDAEVETDAATDAPVDWPEPYVLEPLVDARITSDSASESFQRVRAPIDLHDAPFSRVTLTADLGTTCYPFSGWVDNPPPAGENWPADCDAFDRNFEISLDDPVGEGDPPGLELVRAITPFGGPMHVETDVTDVANGLPGPHTLQVYVTTWSDAAGQVSGSNGGWNVSVRIEAVPGPAPRAVLAVVPLFNGDLGSDAVYPVLPLDVPEGTTASRVEYRATGHGGGTGGPSCIGPAEEFCSRTHTLVVDGEDAVTLDAWRDDCDQLCTIAHESGIGDFDYCQQNPCGAIESVRAPRANWCPGSVTPPAIWAIDALSLAGPHEIQPTVDTILPGGRWRLSIAYVAFGD